MRLDGGCKDSERLVVSRIVVSARTCQMRNLDDNVRRKGHDLREKHPCLPRAVGSVVIYVGMKVDRYRHPMPVRGLKDSLQFRDVSGVIQIDVRVAEVKL